MAEYIGLNGKIWITFDTAITEGNDCYIYNVASGDGEVAKIYKSQNNTPEQEEKLIEMVELNSSYTECYAWPRDVLYKNEQFVGYIMIKEKYYNELDFFDNSIKPDGVESEEEFQDEPQDESQTIYIEKKVDSTVQAKKNKKQWGIIAGIGTAIIIIMAGLFLFIKDFQNKNTAPGSYSTTIISRPTNSRLNEKMTSEERAVIVSDSNTTTVDVTIHDTNPSMTETYIEHSSFSSFSSEETTVSNSIFDHFDESILTAAEIEKEVLKVRKLWNTSVAEIEKNNYEITDSGNGIKLYSQNGELKRVEVDKGFNNFNYSRVYIFHADRMVFAYLEDVDAHRLYFFEDKLYRWRYCSDAKYVDNAVNHDNDFNNIQFIELEQFALKEAGQIVPD